MLGAGGQALVEAAMSIQGKMRNWWNKWTHEIPLSIGDALWDVLVVQFAAFLDRLTIRKVIEFVAIALLVMAFAQTLPIDLAVLFAGDTLMYLEFLLAIRIAAGRELIVAALRLTARLACFAMRQSKTGAIHTMARIGRLRERRHPARAAATRRTSDSSDDDGRFTQSWGALAAA
jgi:hypothetical protein